MQFILLCGPNKDKHGKIIDDCLVPYSFRIEEISNSKFGDLYEVDFIFSKNTNEKYYQTITYKGNKAYEDLPEEIQMRLKLDN